MKQKKHFNEKEGWEECAHLLNTDSIIKERWEFKENFHNAADKQQLSRHVKQTVEYIDLFSPSTILRTSQPILTALHQCSPEAPAAGVFADYSLPKRRLLLLHKTTENYTCVDLDSLRRGKKGANDNLA